MLFTFVGKWYTHYSGVAGGHFLKEHGGCSVPKGAGNWGRDTAADVTRVVKDLARPSVLLVFQLAAIAS